MYSLLKQTTSTSSVWIHLYASLEIQNIHSSLCEGVDDSWLLQIVINPSSLLKYTWKILTGSILTGMIGVM